MTLRSRARALAATTAVLAGLALLPATQAGPAVARETAPEGPAAQTLRGIWSVTGAGIPAGTEARFRGRLHGTVYVTNPCADGVRSSSEGGAWEWSPEGPFAVAYSADRTRGGCSHELQGAAWLTAARSAQPDRLGGWELRDRGGEVRAVLAPKGERAGRLREGVKLGPAAPLPKRFEPATPRSFRGRWFAADARGRLLHEKRIARVRADGSYRTTPSCGVGPSWRWVLDPATGALSTAGVGRYGLWLSCVSQEDASRIRHDRLTAAFSRGVRAGRKGRLLVLTDRQGDVIGRYVRG